MVRPRSSWLSHVKFFLFYVPNLIARCGLPVCARGHGAHLLYRLWKQRQPKQLGLGLVCVPLLALLSCLLQSLKYVCKALQANA